MIESRKVVVNSTNVEDEYKHAKIFIGGIIILSMVIGNMFVSKRMKHIMKVKEGFSKSWNMWTNFSSEAESSSATHKTTANTYATQGNTFNERKTRAVPHEHCIKQIPAEIATSLSLLGLPQNPFPTVQEVKSAYHKLALLTHPDVIPPKDPRKREYEALFKKTADAYGHLIEYIDNQVK